MEISKSGVKLYNLDHIISVKYQPKKEYEYYYFKEKGEVIRYGFLGLFKRTLEEREYFEIDLFGKNKKIQNIYKWIEKKRDYCWLEEDTGKIYYKPRFIFQLITGDHTSCYAEGIESAEKFLEKFKVKPNFIKIDL